ncbi:MAG TPA: YtxH domain-containing protein [Candidatus Saccharimonadales bacterium]|nr:YtxH domain-containing protein [Candidatus Saccharimonadales bacterium]
MSKKTAKRFAIGTAVAGVAGYVAGILTAPKSGKQTRADIKDTADKTINEAEKQLKAMHTELNKLLEEAKKQGGKLSGQAQKDLDVLLEKTKDTKEKAREMISAIHEGDAEDKDLAKAIKQANAAIDNLKTYLKK